jgi:hypothetical protein
VIGRWRRAHAVMDRHGQQPDPGFLAVSSCEATGLGFLPVNPCPLWGADQGGVIRMTATAPLATIQVGTDWVWIAKEEG